jgi:hypothetical protein
MLSGCSPAETRESSDRLNVAPGEPIPPWSTICVG